MFRQAMIPLWRLWALLILFGMCQVPFGTAQNGFYSLGEANIDEYGTAIVAAPDGNLIVGGSRGLDASVMKLSRTGLPLWNVHFPNPSGTRQKVGSLAITPDGYIIGTANTEPDLTHPHRYDGFIFKLDLSGAVIWVRQETHAAPVYLDRILPLSSSQYLVSCAYEFLGSTWIDVLVARINAVDGTVLGTSNRIDLNPTSYLDDPAGLTVGANGDYYVAGRTYINGSDQGSMRPFLLRLNSSLSPVSCNFYQHPVSTTARMYGTELHASGNHLLMLTVGNHAGTTTDYTLGFLKLDLDGNVIWNKDYFVPGAGTQLSWSFAENAQGYHLIGMTDQDWLFSIQTDTAGTVLSSKKIGGGGSDVLALDPWATAITPLDTQIAFVTYRSNGDRQLYLGVMGQSGTVGCVATADLSPLTTVIPPFWQSTSITVIPENLPLGPGPAWMNHTTLFGCAGSPTPYLGNDTSNCLSSMALDATVPGAISYLWQDGSTNPIFVANAPGTYWVLVDNGCCITSDTIVISPAIDVDLGNDFFLCQGDSATLDAGIPGATYLWSTGDTSQTIVAYPPGVYSVTVTMDSACSGQDSVSLLLNVPAINAGPDQERCGEDGAWLVSPNPSLPALWSTGATTDSIYADSSGIYTLTLMTDCGPSSDQVMVTLIKDDRHFVPNVFTPNGDGIQDRFVVDGPVYDAYELRIFDRWGRQLFMSRKIDESWDGTLGGTPCPEGVYFYSLRVVNCDRDLDFVSGPVTIVR